MPLRFNQVFDFFGYCWVPNCSPRYCFQHGPFHGFLWKSLTQFNVTLNIGNIKNKRIAKIHVRRVLCNEWMVTNLKSQRHPSTMRFSQVEGGKLAVIEARIS